MNLFVETRISPYSLIEIMSIRIHAIRCQSTNVLVLRKMFNSPYKALFLTSRIRSLKIVRIGHERRTNDSKDLYIGRSCVVGRGLPRR